VKRDNVVSTQSFPKDREIAAFSRAVIPLQRGPVTRRVFSSRTLRQYTFIKDPKLAAGGKLAQTGNDKLTEMKVKGNLALLIFPGLLHVPALFLSSKSDRQLLHFLPIFVLKEVMRECLSVG